METPARSLPRLLYLLLLICAFVSYRVLEDLMGGSSLKQGPYTTACTRQSMLPSSSSVLFPSVSVSSHNTSDNDEEQDNDDDKISSNSSRHHIAFHLRPTDFVQEMAGCLHNNATCHIMYRHVPKTGGTGIQSFFWKLLVIKAWPTCCYEDMKKRFRAKTMRFCNQGFQSYEVIDGFDAMVHTCDNAKYFQAVDSTSTMVDITNAEPHRVIVLNTLRDPIERFVSKIHQRCNKNLHMRSPEVLATCRRCSFAKDPDYWMKYAHDQGAAEDRLIAQQTMGTLYDYPHLWLDMRDVTSMLQQLQSHFPEQRHQEVFDWYFGQKHNPENLDHCRFAMDTQLIKDLNESKDMYKDFLIGRLWEK